MSKILSKITGWLTDILNPKLSDIFAKRAKALAKTLGSPIFNLTITLVNYTTEFKSITIQPADRQIEMWGLAIHYARELEGNWQVTQQGYLTNHTSYNEKEGLPSHKAIIIIDENIGGLHFFEQLLRGKLRDSEEIQHVSIEYSEDVSRVRVDKKGIYLDNIKRDWELDQALEDTELCSEQWQKRLERMTRKAKAVVTA